MKIYDIHITMPEIITLCVCVLGYFFVFVMQTRLAKTPYVTKDVLAFLILLPPLP